jgi:hypothetical protein
MANTSRGIPATLRAAVIPSEATPSHNYNQRRLKQQRRLMRDIVLGRQQWIPTPFLENEVTEESQSGKAWKFQYRDRFGERRVEWISKAYSAILEDEEGKRRWYLRPLVWNRVHYFMCGKEGL